MAREFGRTQRVADYLRQELARLLQREIRDPRIGQFPHTHYFLDIGSGIGHFAGGTFFNHLHRTNFPGNFKSLFVEIRHIATNSNDKTIHGISDSVGRLMNMLFNPLH